MIFAGTPRLGLPEMDLKHSRGLYLKSWTFLLDVISILPTDLVFLIYPAEGAMMGWRLNRFVRVHRVPEWFDYVISHSAFPIVFRFGRMFLYILVLIHLTVRSRTMTIISYFCPANLFSSD